MSLRSGKYKFEGSLNVFKVTDSRPDKLYLQRLLYTHNLYFINFILIFTSRSQRDRCNIPEFSIYTDHRWYSLSYLYLTIGVSFDVTYRDEIPF